MWKMCPFHFGLLLCALCVTTQINAEFLRVTAVPLLTRFMAQLDKYSTQLLKIIKKKGGIIKAKTASILQFLDQDADADLRRGCVLKSLIIYLGECLEDLIKEYTVVSQNLTQVNATASTNTNTTQQPYSSSTNSTSPTGAGAGLRSGGIGALLAPVLLALHRYC